MRKCGNCRYWKPAHVASSGWCTHPQRDNVNGLALVRETELACRDRQDRDLWESGNDRDYAPVPVPMIYDNIVVHEVIEGVY